MKLLLKNAAQQAAIGVLHFSIILIIIIIIIIIVITNSLKSFMLGLVRAVSATPSLRSGSSGTNTDCKYPGSKICVTGFVSRISFREKCAICYQMKSIGNVHISSMYKKKQEKNLLFKFPQVDRGQVL